MDVLEVFSSVVVVPVEHKIGHFGDVLPSQSLRASTNVLDRQTDGRQTDALRQCCYGRGTVAGVISLAPTVG